MERSQGLIETQLMIPSRMKCERDISRCAGCGGLIHDQYILRVAPDLEWHASCLKCEFCQQFLDETHTCFVYQGRPVCKEDYIKNFKSCAKCKVSFRKDDTVMRARHFIYHLECFRCSACDNSLCTGDEFGLKEEMLYCKIHFEPTLKAEMADADLSFCSKPVRKRDKSFENATTPPHTTVDGLAALNGSRSPGSGSPNSSGGTVAVPTGNNHNSAVPSSKHTTTGTRDTHHRTTGGKHGKETKTTRVRTVLNEKQLSTLRNLYNMNPRPDALMKEHLVDMTGLSPRVIRVWFQNKRCKDKKKQMLMKQIQQQEKNGQRLAAIQGMQGVAMVAGSPVRHVGDPHLQINPVDIRSYHQPQPAWKALENFAVQNDLVRHPMNGSVGLPGDHGHDPTNAFQQLLHGFADPTMGGMLQHGQDYGGHPGGGDMYDLGGDDSYQHAPNSVSSSTLPSDLSSPEGSTE
ncbi:insulin gene enhancer protein isl-1-like [Paramacrobiotus metropolitanus]|uniref:insulin gene enhancer protein isl-1-like n=1 Tax=Paramacrobiotus metropolitanus TaxID=2943436 RepID=UPI002445950C|nr:insulin gene enhancer protein isl-1-like [Paramacrobiotus metropolitanus]